MTNEKEYDEKKAVKEIYLGSSKLSTAGTTTIPAKVREKAGMLSEDELKYYLLPNGDILIRDASKIDLLTLGTDYVVREFDSILKSDERVFYFYGNANPYYGPAIMAAYIQFNQGKFNDGSIELTENGIELYKKFAEDSFEDEWEKRNFRQEDKRLYNELERYKSNDTASLYLINAMTNFRDIADIPELLKNTDAKVFVLSINNHHESDLQRVVDQYIHIQYDSHHPIVASKINVTKGTKEKLTF